MYFLCLYSSDSTDESSCRLEFDGDDVIVVSSSDESDPKDLQYVEGDVTRPKSIITVSSSSSIATRRTSSATSLSLTSIDDRASEAETESTKPKPSAPAAAGAGAGDDDYGPAIIAHCVDASGRWGRGGLFDAIARRPGGHSVPAYYSQAAQRRGASEDTASTQSGSSSGRK